MAERAHTLESSAAGTDLPPPPMGPARQRQYFAHDYKGAGPSDAKPSIEPGPAPGDRPVIRNEVIRAVNNAILHGPGRALIKQEVEKALAPYVTPADPEPVISESAPGEIHTFNSSEFPDYQVRPHGAGGAAIHLWRDHGSPSGWRREPDVVIYLTPVMLGNLLPGLADAASRAL